MRHLTSILVLCIAALTAAGDSAGTIERALVSVSDDIAAATEELNRVRDEVAEQKTPLSARIHELRGEVRELRRELDDSRRARQMQAAGVERLESDVARLEDDLQFVGTALLEYRRAFETYAGPAESLALEPELSAIDAALANGGEPADDVAAQQLLRVADEWARARFRSRVFEGLCLDPEGREIAGRFAVVGPLEYFSSESTAGIVVLRPGSAYPSVFSDLSDTELDQIDRLVREGAATVPVDVTDGGALKVRHARKGFVEHLRDGGFTMYPLLAIGALSLILAVWKFISLGAVTVCDSKRVRAVARLVRAGDEAAAEAAVAEIGQPLRNIVHEGVIHRRAPRELIEEIMHERVLITVPVLRRYLGALAVFGAVAPLLGLLGTVTGMIHTFQLVTIFGTGDAKMLSGGISEALVTTETGLAIAIPVLLVHAYLARRVVNMAGKLENSVVEFVGELRDEDGTLGDS